MNMSVVYLICSHCYVEQHRNLWHNKLAHDPDRCKPLVLFSFYHFYFSENYLRCMQLNSNFILLLDSTLILKVVITEFVHIVDLKLCCMVIVFTFLRCSRNIKTMLSPDDVDLALRLLPWFVVF